MPATDDIGQPDLAAARTQTTTSPVMRAVSVGVLVISVLMLWFSAMDHPLYVPDEGRYATISANMADGGGWLAPHWRGEPHLKKPPLTYWLQATGIKALGRVEAAVRLPSLLASSLVMILLFVVANQMGGLHVAALSVGVYSMMPLTVAVGRLAIPDPLLNLFWFGVLGFGYLAVATNRARWVVLLWASLALGLLTKGPVALTPLVILFLWLVLGRKWRELKRLSIPIGLSASLAPVIVWGAALLAWHPDAVAVWQHELLDRVVGTGDHSEPIWYFLPVFVGGVFPATAMLPVPGLNVRWATIVDRVRSGSPLTLWALAGLIPLVFFSLIGGKLPTYILPICAPWALLTGLMLERWLNGEADQATGSNRPPGVAATLTISFVLVTIAAFVLLFWFDWHRAWIPLPLVLVVFAAFWMWYAWKRRPERRGWAMAGVWLAMTLSWACIFEGEDTLWKNADPHVMLKRIETASAELEAQFGRPPGIVAYQFRDESLDFYLGHESIRVKTPADVMSAIDDLDGNALVIIDVRDWPTDTDPGAKLFEQLEKVATYKRWRDREMLILRPTGTSAAIDR